ncbi:hypothetical protein FRC06_003494 [Ceratobasidium sp. 370]|nr:hypothetical protein FRC06_003494 [Ceratobasidium sp. 370]
MVEQIQIKQWYRMVGEATGKLKCPKRRPVVKFRNLSIDKSSCSGLSGKHPISVALDDEAGDEWLDPTSRANLLDFLSDTPRDNGSSPGEARSTPVGEQSIQKAADVVWE